VTPVAFPPKRDSRSIAAERRSPFPGAWVRQPAMRWDRSAPGASVGLFRSRPGPVIVEGDTRRGLAVDAQRSTPNGALAWGPIATGPVSSPNSPRRGQPPSAYVARPPKRDRRMRAIVVRLEATDRDLDERGDFGGGQRAACSREQPENRIAPGRGVVPWSVLRRLRRSAASPIKGREPCFDDASH
jgi:hypothetical protein